VRPGHDLRRTVSPDDLLCQIASDLDRLMSARSLDQKSLHQMARVGEGTVSRLLRARDFRLSTLVRVGLALGVTVRVTFHGEQM